MRKLDRASVAAPTCLTTHDYLTQDWNKLRPDCKKQLRAALLQMQGIPGVTTLEANEYGLRCAYCEGRVYHGGHVEHFRRKNADHYPELTFAWSNLFLSCGAYTHCGHYKDRKEAPPYSPDLLIKPDEHDPDKYLYFHSSGEIRVRDKLNTCDIQRASETIRVFGLNAPTLVGGRTKALNVYKKTVAADLEVVAAWPKEELNAYLEGELEATKSDPYATTIRHFLRIIVHEA